mmetsp:Transcript_89791/g.262479  ORF Transcript_89791/g.262479 Transcript_89791/m.262479 type:complete len:260 (+) Transcript_89791:54-833(+)
MVKRVGPGPGAFKLPAFPEPSPASTVVKEASYSIPSGRKEPQQTPDSARLGPGAYHPRTDVACVRAPGGGFGRSRRLLSEPPPSHAPTPGPDLPQSDGPRWKASPRYGFGSEVKNFRAPVLWNSGPGRGARSPGPGEHCPDDRATSQHAATAGPSYSMRAPESKPHAPGKGPKPSPGPGAYSREESDTHSSLRPSAPRAKFGTEARLEPGPGSGRRALPGPGRYDATGVTRTGHGSFGDSAPRWTMSARRELDLSSNYV